jgi:CheY-like chemotaxis protein
MPHRVREVLLVSSLYDAFIFEEDGQISELIFQEYARLNLRYAPRVTRVSTAEQALELLESGRRFDLVITTMHLGGTDPVDFGHQIKEQHPNLPVVLLGYDTRELQEMVAEREKLSFDHVFVWTGDSRILLAIVKIVEDAVNADYDTKEIGVEVILLVEDSVHFISSYLPALYALLAQQSQTLIGEGFTLAHKLLRMRARPKILVAYTYEEAVALFERYREHMLGIITDRSYPREGTQDPRAGAALAQYVRQCNSETPILLQSTEFAAAEDAAAVGAQFVHKESPRLLAELKQFMLQYFGFGPFVFRLADGTEVARAHDQKDLRTALEQVPLESLKYHAERNHYSTWLKARTEFRLAARLRPLGIEDFKDLEDLRRSLIQILDDHRRMSYQDIVPDFDSETFGSLINFARIGEGSLGGKARGLAFVNTLLRQYDLAEEYPDVRITVPRSVVIATDHFDKFIESNDLGHFSRGGHSDEEMRAAFLRAQLPADLTWALMTLINIIDYPIAVRSSSLLEDSQYQPFAGVYETYMLPNNAPKPQHRLEDLSSAIKLVYASTFSSRARAYLSATPHRPEKEKMAVIIQRLIGKAVNGRFYPTLAGVAESHNHYPFGPVKPEDGVAYVVAGLGKAVVEGEGGLRFSPNFPAHLPQFSAVDDVLSNAQRTFYALPLDQDNRDVHTASRPASLPISLAAEDGMLDPIASVYCPENHTIHAGAARPGTKLATFASVLKGGLFPLPQILSNLLTIGKETMNAQVEIEFAANIETGRSGQREFACLQMRPIAEQGEMRKVDISVLDQQEVFCESERALGNGRIEGITDIVMVDPGVFERRRSTDTAQLVAAINGKLQAAGRPYILMGPGRWGSSDPWLGIPVTWGQIGGVRVVVETGFDDFCVMPSEGSHFFHNMTSFHVGYLTTNPQRGEGRIDWDWLKSQPVIEQCDNGLRWVRLENPALGMIDGRSGRGVILKRSVAAEA